MLKILKWTFFLVAIWVITTAVMALFMPPVGLFAISFFIGIGMIVSGFLEILLFSTEKQAPRSDLMLASGVLSTIFGIWIVFGNGIYVVTIVLPYVIGVRLAGSMVAKVVEYKTGKSDKYMVHKETVIAYDHIFIGVTIFVPKGRIIGVVQVIHGLWEGSLNYSELGAFFATHGFVFVTHEQRTHGLGWWLKNWRVMFRSKKQVYSYNMLLQDVDTVRKMINDRYPTLGIILFGYSMGGNVAANYLIRYNQDKYKKAILAAPWFRLYESPQPFRLGINRIKLAHILNGARRMPLRMISMVESRPNLYMLYQIKAAGERALQRADQIRIKTLIFSASDDTLVSNTAINAFAQNNPAYIEIKEYKHEDHALHWGRNKEKVMQDMLDFCNAQNRTDKNPHDYHMAHRF